MNEEYFVMFEKAFGKMTKKCTAFIEWAETLDHSVIVSGPYSEDTFDTFVKIVKKHCEELNKEIPSSRPLKVETKHRLTFEELFISYLEPYDVGRFLLTRIDNVIEINYDDQLNVTYYAYRIQKEVSHEQ